MNIQEIVLKHVDFNWVLNDLVEKSQMDLDNPIHKKIMEFRVRDMHKMTIERERCLISSTFIDFSWIDENEEYAIEITFDSEDGFTEFERVEIGE